MNTDAIFFTAGFLTATAIPQPANATLKRIAPAQRRIPGRFTVRWTVSLGGSERHPGLRARSA